MRVSVFALVFVLIFPLCTSFPADARVLVSSHKKWKVFTDDKSCYIISFPLRNSGNFSRRGNPYLLVVHRGKNTDEINASSGYPYKAGKDVVAAIDGKQYDLFSQGEIAWAYDEKQDREMVNAMKRGKKMTIRGTSKKGTWSQDFYSLLGFTAAYKRMKSLCK